MAVCSTSCEGTHQVLPANETGPGSDDTVGVQKTLVQTGSMIAPAMEPLSLEQPANSRDAKRTQGSSIDDNRGTVVETARVAHRRGQGDKFSPDLTTVCSSATVE
jgi:hypothetical protein